MKDFEDLGLINVKEIQTNYGVGKIGYLENLQSGDISGDLP